MKSAAFVSSSMLNGGMEDGSGDASSYPIYNMSRITSTTKKRTYLALGDSMSIDDYTGVEGGGAARQFFRMLGEGWVLDDRTFDGCMMAGVPRDGKGDVITLTIGGNDLLWNKEKYLAKGLDEFVVEHKSLLMSIRTANPNADFIVGDIYAPAFSLSKFENAALAAANAAIHANCQEVGAILAPIHAAFRGHEQSYLCLNIEPTLAGAGVIADLFQKASQRT